MDEQEQNKNKLQQDHQEESPKPKYKYPKTISRRRFLINTSLFVGGVAALLTGTTAIVYQSELRKKIEGATNQNPNDKLVFLGEKSKFDNLAELTEIDFQTEIQDGWVTQNVKGAVYVNKDQNNQLLIMSPVCTHLGCTVASALEKERQSKPDLAFKCPCHGGEFDEFGNNIGGPPPSPLDIYKPVVQGDKVYFDYYSLKKR
jgi:menaquinol-cytochrome c reductase iron-sulfur subunit